MKRDVLACLEKLLPVLYIASGFIQLNDALIVPEPFNITLQCDNFKNVLYWNYSQTTLEHRFFILITMTKGHPVEKYISSENHYLDLSPCHDPSNDYTVTVRAEIQGMKSNDNDSNKRSFSYNSQHLHAIKICSISLPPVTVTAQDELFTFTFPNPSAFYREFEDLSGSKMFSYLVETKGQNAIQQFNCSGKVCVINVLGDPEFDQCIKIKNGLLMDISVHATQDYYCSNSIRHLSSTTVKAVAKSVADIPTDDWLVVAVPVAVAALLKLGFFAGFFLWMCQKS